MATRSNAQHNRKKQVQTSIASFLKPTAPAGESVRPPSPPHETQAMLMSVGMRVRKSVPEGYKTQEADLSKSSMQSGIHDTGSLPQSSFDLSSQQTVSSQSSFSSASDPRKRTYDEEAEEAMDLIFEAEEQSAKARPIAKARARAQRPHDFEDATFLQPLDEMDIG